MGYHRSRVKSTPLIDYRRPCDRCGWDGWYRSELTREYPTNLIVCKNCLDKNICGLADPNFRAIPKEQKFNYD